MRVEHLHTELADGKLLEGLLANGRSPLQPPSESPCLSQLRLYEQDVKRNQPRPQASQREEG
jgi:hypothetical protein